MSARSSNAAWLVPGCTLDRYELLLPMAEGGMAMLWLARQSGKHGFDRIVALKTMSPRFASDPGFQRMFMDEARLVSRVAHPNVAQVLDLGEDSGVLFLVMEWVDGDSLINLCRAITLAGLPGIPLGILTRIVADACAGLHAVHEIADDEGQPLNVVHRDVSPHNLLVSFRGATKVIDFGIAKARNRIAHDTSTGIIKGKVAYMAPEQAMGMAVDRRTDVWSAGAIMYRFITGHVPYSAPEPMAVLRRIVQGQSVAPLEGNVPAPLRAVVERALEREPADRFASAAEMATALEAAAVESGENRTTEEVAAYMHEHLGETRAKRAREIEQVLRQSRARMKAAPADAGSSPSSASVVASASGSRVRHEGAGLGDLGLPNGSAEILDLSPDPSEPPRAGPQAVTARPGTRRRRSRIRFFVGAGTVGLGVTCALFWFALRPVGLAHDTKGAPSAGPASVAPPPPVAPTETTVRLTDPPAASLQPETVLASASVAASVALSAAVDARPAPVTGADVAAINRDSTVASLLERARTARRTSRLSDAASLFAAAIAKEPDNSEALTGQAQIEAIRGAVPEATADYRRAIAANGRYLPARLELADLLWAQGQRADAQRMYRSIVDEFPASLCPDRTRDRAARGEDHSP